ncbi:hypothetical protein BB559_004865 [Furculomyces boomerangus]|uniref:Elongator complex protein 2 n=1 Tax=Furculomyces boomerangus TaxID=61424 RepID=A0A2T9YC98_9FUNG|nr:hypothetical protein BB559_004865 [Furculomyces boomerangus]
MVSVSVELISGACNRVPNCLSIKSIQDKNSLNPTKTTDLAVYGVGNAVALVDLSDYIGIKQTLQGHSDRVNYDDHSMEIFSGSSDKTGKIWTLKDENWECTATLNGHTDSVTMVQSIPVKNNNSVDDFTHILATASVDGSIKIWKKYGRGGNVDNIQTITNGRHSPFSLILGRFPIPNVAGKSPSKEEIEGYRDISGVFLASGNTDSKIHFYTWNSSTQIFDKSLVLSGHEDWVTSLSSTTFFDPTQDASKNPAINHWNNGDVILASGSQDRYCRLWRISADRVDKETLKSTNNNTDDDTTSNSDDEDFVDKEYGKSEILAALDSGDIAKLSVRVHKIISRDNSYSLEVESILSGHDGWIHSVNWQSPISSVDDLQIVTASGDQSVLLWKPEADSGVWESEVKLGEVGGSNFGFFSAILSDDGNTVVAIEYHGSLHVWRNVNKNSKFDSQWVQDVAPTGHFESVEDIQWEPNGRYLLSHSIDKTARIYGPWNASDNGQHKFNGWHEIARPQIHGYELTCATFVTPLCYASGADEKVVRIFEAPIQFVESYNKLCVSSALSGEKSSMVKLGGNNPNEKARAVEASIPPLGLSNKAIFQDEINAAAENFDKDEDLELRRQTHVEAFVTSRASGTGSEGIFTSELHKNGHPPLEENLRRRTLWPETNKIYGHPYETFAIASCEPVDTSVPGWLAVSCKAAVAKHAGIRLFDSNNNWRPAQNHKTLNASESQDASPLAAHTLTVTKIAFKPKESIVNDTNSKPIGAVLLSVGRDRSVSVFQQVDEDTSPDGEPFKLVQHVPKAHARIVWDCSWSPDGYMFGTASRDKTVKLWIQKPESEEYAVVNTIKLVEAATAINITESPLNNNSYWIAVGLENGEIVIFDCEKPNTSSEPSNPVLAPFKIQKIHTISQR